MPHVNLFELTNSKYTYRYLISDEGGGWLYGEDSGLKKQKLRCFSPL